MHGDNDGGGCGGDDEDDDDDDDGDDLTFSPFPYAVFLPKKLLPPWSPNNLLAWTK